MPINCPICKGTGKLREPVTAPKIIQTEKAKIAKKLRGAGYSFREIMKVLNYKSTNSVSKLLNM